MSNYDILTNKKKTNKGDLPTKPQQPDSDSSNDEEMRDGQDS